MREVFSRILIGFVILMNVLRVIDVCLQFVAIAFQLCCRLRMPL
jgi:hypothetical protein